MKIACVYWSAASMHLGRCRLGFYGGMPSYGTCLQVCQHGPKIKGCEHCGSFEHESEKCQSPRPEPVRALPYADWPDQFKTWATDRESGDKGVGDTMKRLIDRGGIVAVAIRAAMKAYAGSCNCDANQARMNLEMPYDGKEERPVISA